MTTAPHRTVTVTGNDSGASVYYLKAVADLRNVSIWFRLSSAPELSGTPLSWRRDFRGKRKILAEFSHGDIKVALMSVLKGFKLFAGRTVRSLVGKRFD